MINEQGDYNLNSEQVREATMQLLQQRGVHINDIAELVVMLQQSYYPDLTLREAQHHIESVLEKREVQNAVLTGIMLDILAENNQLLTPLQEMVQFDEGLYGCDEILALSIVNVYGSIGLTNFGYIDKVKPGILAQLNEKNERQVHTFLDDIIGAIAAAASSRIAHRYHSDAEVTV